METVGVNLVLDWGAAYCFFTIFMARTMLNAFIVYTNLFAHTMCLVGWVDLSLNESKRLLAIKLLIGLVKLAERRDYWYGSDLQPFVTSLMSYI